MNSKTARRIRAAARYNPCHTPKYNKVELQRIDQMPTFETYDRTVRTMGPAQPGAPANMRFKPIRTLFFSAPYEYSVAHECIGRWIPRAGSRRTVEARTVTKIRRPAKPVVLWDALKLAFIPQYELIPVTKPITLDKTCSKGIYRLLKKLEQKVGLDRVYAQMAAEVSL